MILRVLVATWFWIKKKKINKIIKANGRVLSKYFVKKWTNEGKKRSDFNWNIFFFLSRNSRLSGSTLKKSQFYVSRVIVCLLYNNRSLQAIYTIKSYGVPRNSHNKIGLNSNNRDYYWWFDGVSLRKEFGRNYIVWVKITREIHAYYNSYFSFIWISLVIYSYFSRTRILLHLKKKWPKIYIYIYLENALKKNVIATKT